MNAKVNSGDVETEKSARTTLRQCPKCGAYHLGDRCPHGCSPPPPEPPSPPPPESPESPEPEPQQLAVIVISRESVWPQKILAEATAEFLGLPKGNIVYRSDRYDVIAFQVPPGRQLPPRTGLGWQGLTLLAGDAIPKSLRDAIKAEPSPPPMLPDWIPEELVRVVQEQTGILPRHLTVEPPGEDSAKPPAAAPPPASTPAIPQTDRVPEAPAIPQRRRLPRRKPDVRQLHHRCHNLQTGLFKQRGITGDADHIALTHACGKPTHCRPCARFDRDRRYGDYEYAVESCEPADRQLYMFQTSSDLEWAAFRRAQGREAKRRGEQFRRWESRQDAPDGTTVRHVITPIPHPKATPISRDDAAEAVRALCDGLHTRGAKRTTVRCWGAWGQERREPKLERVCRSIPATAEIEAFLQAIGVEYKAKVSSRGTVYRTLVWHYDNEDQRAAVVTWFRERDRQHRMSRSEVIPSDCDSKERLRRILARFGDDFERDRRRRVG